MHHISPHLSDVGVWMWAVCEDHGTYIHHHIILYVSVMSCLSYHSNGTHIQYRMILYVSVMSCLSYHSICECHIMSFISFYMAFIYSIVWFYMWVSCHVFHIILMVLIYSIVSFYMWVSCHAFHMILYVSVTSCLSYHSIWYSYTASYDSICECHVMFFISGCEYLVKHTSCVFCKREFVCMTHTCVLHRKFTCKALTFSHEWE